MELWNKFYLSGKISDYLDYARFEKEGDRDDNLKGTDYTGNGQR